MPGPPRGWWPGGRASVSEAGGPGLGSSLARALRRVGARSFLFSSLCFPRVSKSVFLLESKFGPNLRALNLRAFWVRASRPRVGRGRGGAPPQLLRPSGRASAGGPGLASSRARLFFVAPSLFRAAATFFMAVPWFSTSGNQESAAAFRHHYA